MALVKGRPVEPGLTIVSDGKSSPMARISDEEYEGKVRDPWFKFLGRILLENLTEERTKEVLCDMVKGSGEKIDAVALRGVQKVWIWDSYVMAKISWMLLIHDISPTFVKNVLQPVQTRWFKSWLGYPRTGNTSIFYRSNAHHGLQLKEMVSWHKQNRLIRRHILESSQDAQVKAIHASLAKKQRDSHAREWKDCNEIESLKQVVLFEKIRGPLKQDGVGLGWGAWKFDPTASKSSLAASKPGLAAAYSFLAALSLAQQRHQQEHE